MIIFKKAGNTMKNVKENKRRWKQLVAIFIVAVMLFTTPHIVGFASMGKEEATTAAADGNPDNSDVKVQSEDADSEEDIQTESLDASEQSESSEEKTTEKKTETTEAEKKTGADESKKEKAEESMKYFENIGEKLTAVLSGASWIDIANKTESKGNAIKAICEKYGIAHTEAMGFGDYLNDMSLLESCGESYCMKNGHPTLKALAKYVTEKTNDENGVMEVLKTL